MCWPFLMLLAQPGSGEGGAGIQAKGTTELKEQRFPTGAQPGFRLCSPDNHVPSYWRPPYADLHWSVSEAGGLACLGSGLLNPNPARFTMQGVGRPNSGALVPRGFHGQIRMAEEGLGHKFAQGREAAAWAPAPGGGAGRDGMGREGQADLESLFLCRRSRSCQSAVSPAPLLTHAVICCQKTFFHTPPPLPPPFSLSLSCFSDANSLSSGRGDPLSVCVRA